MDEIKSTCGFTQISVCHDQMLIEHFDWIIYCGNGDKEPIFNRKHFVKTTTPNCMYACVCAYEVDRLQRKKKTEQNILFNIT